jgi:Sulfatase
MLTTAAAAAAPKSLILRVLAAAAIALGLLASMRSTQTWKDAYDRTSVFFDDAPAAGAAAAAAASSSSSSSSSGSSMAAPHRERLRSSSNGKGSPYVDPATGKGRDMNVVLLYADDWTWRTLGFVNKVVKTPHLDEMARRGMSFSHNCVTTSICWQSRATKSTGLYVSVHNQRRLWDLEMFDKTVPWKDTLYPQLFGAGYNVGFFGKWCVVGGWERERVL